MQTYLKHSYWTLIFTTVFLASCLKTEEFPVEPAISFVSFETKGSGADLKLTFTDGDGDIGLDPGDTLAPFDLSSKYYYNLFIRYYELQNGQWILIPITNPPLSYRTPKVTPTGQNKSLNGNMTINLTLYYNAFSLYDTLKLDVQLVDRALHESNIIEIGPLLNPH
jgi:hypothetical protein